MYVQQPTKSFCNNLHFSLATFYKKKKKKTSSGLWTTCPMPLRTNHRRRRQPQAPWEGRWRNGFPNNAKPLGISFPADVCKACPHRNECSPHFHKQTASLNISRKGRNRARCQREMKGDKFSGLCRLRNGVETVPSNLRKNFHIDKLPRGKQRGKFFFGSKIAALNFRKLFNSLLYMKFSRYIRGWTFMILGFLPQHHHICVLHNGVWTMQSTPANRASCARQSRNDSLYDLRKTASPSVYAKEMPLWL